MRAGNIDEALAKVRPLNTVLSEMSGVDISPAPAEPPAPALLLEFLNSSDVFSGETVELRFRVLEGGKPVTGAN